jgi:DegV family protein with EDD domain
MIKIVTDTTCNLPPAWFSRYDLTVIPFTIQFGLETFREGLDITPEIFYDRIQTEQALPTTSQPAIGDFINTYQTLGRGGAEIISIHVTSKLSGAWQAAVLAARQLKNETKVHVLDSLTGSVGLGLMVREGAELTENGLSAVDIVERLEARRAQIKVFIMLKDLRYARMSGRVGALRESLASLLKVKPIIGVEQGALVPVDRVRGHKQGLARMLALAEAAVGQTPVHLGLTHALAPTEADTLLAQLRDRLNCRDTFVADLALSLAAHFGPGTVGFATYPAE